MAIKMKKTRVKMTKPLYLGMSILDISKTLMYEFWYDYIRQKYGDKAKFCYTDTDSFVVHIKNGDFLKIFLMMLRDGLIHVTMIKMVKDLFQQVGIKKYQIFLKMNQEERLLQKLLRLEQQNAHT